MDFLPRYFTYRALVGAFCLVFSSFAFSAVLDHPNYSWRLSSNGDVYRVYDPQGGRASSVFTPSSTFAEGSSSGVIETFAPSPLLIDGATGEVIAGLSRSLTVGDLVGGLTDAMSGPLGAAIIGASNLLPFLDALYNQYQSAQQSVTSPSDPPISSTNPYFGPGDCNLSGAVGSSPFAAFNAYWASAYTPISASDDSGTNWKVSVSGGWDSIVSCSGTPSDTAPSGYGSSSPPSNIVPWVVNNWTSDGLASDASTVLNNNPSYSPLLADQLAANDAPLSSPVPYVYNPTSNSLSSPSTTSTSTNPSTGDSTVTTTTPSYKVSPGTNGGLNVAKSTTVVTQSCTSAGSCTTTNTSISTSTPQTPSPFVAPTLSLPIAPTAPVKSFALSLSIPEQSVATCPKPLSISALSTTFYIPVTPLCNLATDVKPYVESLGAVGAGVVIFR